MNTSTIDLISQKPDQSIVSVYGVIVKIGAIEEKKTRWGETSLRKCTIKDETGFLVLNTWKDHFTAELGDVIFAKNLTIKSFRNVVEGTVTANVSSITKLQDTRSNELEIWYAENQDGNPTKIAKTTNEFINISQLTTTCQNTACIRGICISVSVEKDIKDKNTTLRKILIQDSTGVVTLNTWGSHFPVNENDYVSAANVQVKQYNNTIEVTADQYSEIKVNEDQMKQKATLLRDSLTQNKDSSTMQFLTPKKQTQVLPWGEKRIIDEIQDELNETSKQIQKLEAKKIRLETELSLHEMYKKKL